MNAIQRKERIPVQIYETSVLASRSVAEEIAQLIRDKASKGEHCVLGLATGSTPKTVYAELIRMHEEDGLSFANVVTFIFLCIRMICKATCVSCTTICLIT